MDVEDIIERIPSIEKILGSIWILCWILGIWMYHVQFFLTGLFCLFLVLLLLGVFDRKEKEESQNPPIIFSMDKNTRSLKVQMLYEKGLKWDETEICSGTCKLPDGEIRPGDTVTNCKGNIALRHVPSNTIMGAYDFQKTK